MKHFIILVLSSFVFMINVAAQNKFFSNEKEKKAVRMAVDIVRGFYPDVQLLVSDTIWDDYWTAGPTKEVNKEFAEILDNHYYERLFSKNLFQPPYYSKELHDLFDNINKQSQQRDIKKWIEFFEPYNNVLWCEIRPYIRWKIGIMGEPVIQTFFFRYDENGDIFQVFRSDLLID